MLNKIILQGRFVKNPEIRYTQSKKAVVSFTLAVDRDIKATETTDFIDCTAWGKTAEFVDQYFIKGQQAVVVGRLQMRNWTDKTGSKRTSAEVQVDSIYFGDNKRKEESSETGFEELNESSGELPF